MSFTETISKLYYFNIIKLLLLITINIFYLLYQPSNILFRFGMAIYLINYIFNTKFVKYKKVYNTDKVGLIVSNISEKMDNVIALHHLINEIKNKSQNFKSIFSSVFTVTVMGPKLNGNYEKLRICRSGDFEKLKSTLVYIFVKN